jgi:hypothetical protein
MEGARDAGGRSRMRGGDMEERGNERTRTTLCQPEMVLKGWKCKSRKKISDFSIQERFYF